METFVGHGILFGFKHARRGGRRTRREREMEADLVDTRNYRDFDSSKWTDEDEKKLFELIAAAVHAESKYKPWTAWARTHFDSKYTAHELRYRYERMILPRITTKGSWDATETITLVSKIQQCWDYRANSVASWIDVASLMNNGRDEEKCQLKWKYIQRISSRNLQCNPDDITPTYVLNMIQGPQASGVGDNAEAAPDDDDRDDLDE